MEDRLHVSHGHGHRLQQGRSRRRGGGEGGEKDRGTNTLATWRPEDLREMAGFWTMEKKAAWSLEILRVKAISWAKKVLIFL
jgi:hypothetical protein